MKSLSFFVMIITLLCSGCSLSYTINEPTVSGIRYENVIENKFVLNVVDKRDEKAFMTGITGLKNVTISIDNISDPVDWFAHELEKEILSRGVPIKVVVNDKNSKADATLTVEKYQIVNHRASGFSAWESYHLFLGQITKGDKACSIPAYFFNSKIPVWSMDEIKQPCLDLPASVIIKETASKINKCIFDYEVSDSDIEKLKSLALKSAGSNPSETCLSAIALGGTNKASAIETLKQLSRSDDSLIRTCAVSEIGMLGGGEQYNFLIEKFRSFSDNDKIMPIKSIADIGNEQSSSFLKTIRNDSIYKDENGVKYCVDLYLNK